MDATKMQFEKAEVRESERKKNGRNRRMEVVKEIENRKNNRKLKEGECVTGNKNNVW